MRLTKDNFNFCAECQKTGFEGGMPICISFEHNYPVVKQIKKDCKEKRIYDKLRMYEQKYE